MLLQIKHIFNKKFKFKFLDFFKFLLMLVNIFKMSSLVNCTLECKNQSGLMSTTSYKLKLKTKCYVVYSTMLMPSVCTV